MLNMLYAKFYEHPLNGYGGIKVTLPIAIINQVTIFIDEDIH